MAEIKIERKPNRSLWWLWLIIALIILFLLWWFFWRTPAANTGAVATDSTTAAAPMAGAGGTAAAGGAVATFDSFASTSRADSMGIDHVNTATGLRDLAAAGEALASRTNGAPPVSARADSLRSLADQLQKDTASLRHADMVHRAFTIGATMLRDLKSAANASSADVDAVQKAADAIAPGTPLLDQRGAVQRYWDAADSALRAIGS